MRELKLLPMHDAISCIRSSGDYWAVSQAGRHELEIIRGDRSRYVLKKLYGEVIRECKTFSNARKIAEEYINAGYPPATPLVQFRLVKNIQGPGRVRAVIVNAQPPDETPSDPRFMVMRDGDGGATIESVPLREIQKWHSQLNHGRHYTIIAGMLNRRFKERREAHGRLIPFRHYS